MLGWLKKIYIRSTGYSYTNMGRLFLRLFVGIMLMQFGLRQACNFDESVLSFPSVCGLSEYTSLMLAIIVEIGCSFFIMIGFCTRIMTLPPIIGMIVTEWYILKHVVNVPSYMMTFDMPGYLPMMFLGIYYFLLLVGPGKISVDYFLSLHFIHTANKNEETELETV